MKKYVKWTIGLTAGILALIMAMMIVLDPLMQYHMPWFGLQPVVSNQSQYSVPGLAKNYEYTNAIIGTSMSENFKPSWFDSVLGGKTAKLTIYGSHTVEYHKVLDLVLSRNETENVVMNIDGLYLLSDPKVGRWENLPTYLYDNNYLNDVNYLLNKDIILKFGRKFVHGNITKNTTDLDDLFSWDSDSVYGSDIVRGLIEEDVGMIDADTLACYQLWCESNLETLYTLLENNSNVHFYVFVAPYSIAWWYDELRAGKIDLWENMYKQMCDKLLFLDNVNIYFLANSKSKELITDLDNYKDKEHYSAEINKYISDCIANQENLLNINNYDVVLTDFFNFIRNYDYIKITK